MEFQIRKAINNLYTAIDLENNKSCTLRIKGKILKGEREYNPIAVGDIAYGELYSENEGLITSIKERKSSFSRWNIKAKLNQIIVSNQDQTAIVISAFSPPFRPRFIDRAIASSSGADILLILNKADYSLKEEEEKRWNLYSELGFKTIKVSALTGEGIGELEEILNGKITAFVGQSGVGKSTLINKLLGSNQVTNDVSEKYNRGRHTTNHSIFLEGKDFTLIDTPGVREINVPFEDKREVLKAFPELINLDCFYPNCMHMGEDGCLAPYLVEDGTIDEDRYFSYQRIIESIDERIPLYMREKIKNGRKIH